MNHENLCTTCEREDCYHGQNNGVAHRCDGYHCNGYSHNLPKPAKDKEGKDTLLIMLEYFPRSMAALGDMFEKAHATGKYERNSFHNVPIFDLLDAELRHVRDHTGGEIYNDKDFGHPHLVHNAGNALMALENLLRELSDE